MKQRLPADLLERSSQEGAHRIARGLLDQVHAEVPRLQDPSDEEALHDFRVAVRRLRSALSAWRTQLRGSIAKRHRRALRGLQSATGGGRDAEVAQAWIEEQAESVDVAVRPSVLRIAAQIGGKHANAMEEVRTEIPTAFYDIEVKLRKRLAKMQVQIDDDEKQPVFASVFADKVREHGADLAAHLRLVESIDHRNEAHVARIRCKRLRYLLEPLRGAVPGAQRVVKICKELQDVLGDFNDAHVLEDLLAELPVDSADMSIGVKEVRRLASERREHLYALVRDEWLDHRLTELLDRVEKVARACLKAAGPRKEIERKYLLKSLPPEMPSGLAVEIDQGWLPGRVLQERIRRIRSEDGEFHFRTVKIGSGLERIEIEEDTSPEVFEVLWPLTEGRRVRKRRYLVEADGHTWEVDEFLDRELVLAEVELSAADETADVPSWVETVLEREVTEEPQYANVTLAQ